MSIRSVAIDGPAGAGKSTIARAAASRLGFIYVDTGAMYRAIGLYALQNGIARSDAAAVEAALEEIGVEISYGEDGLQHILLNGEDVNGLIRTPEVSLYASAVSAMPPVRAFLLETQRNLAARRSVIMDGRDIGTVVLPDAAVKIFLTASPEARAKRRYAELKEKGTDVSFEDVLADMTERDRQDTQRSIAPLRPAEDAVTVDTSELSLEESIEAVLTVITEGLV